MDTPTRRHFLSHSALGFGSAALASMLADDAHAADAPKAPHFPAKAKSIIFLFMAGGPSQIDLFDPKPRLQDLHGQTIPESFTKGQRFAFIKGDAKIVGSPRKFARAGRNGMTISELMPHHRDIADEVCWLQGVKTDVFNHGPAKSFINSGSPQFGRPSMGSWLTYGLGSESRDLPGFVVLQSGPRGPRGGSSLWSSGFLPSAYQGVPFLKGSSPILDLKNPAGVDAAKQRQFGDVLGDLNRQHSADVGDPEIGTRIAAYEMAFRMQAAAPDLIDLSKESKETLALYGAEPNKPSFAANCLLARRMVERGVRFVQLYHTDWDHHGGDLDLGKPLDKICGEVDKPSAALVKDLKRKGLLDSTIVVWGGEFGRTPMGEVRATTGRDHHVEASTMWLAGGGFKPGLIHGKTDEIGYRTVEGAVHVHDLQATLLHQMGLDHTKLTYRSQGRDFRLTDVHGKVVREVLA